MHDFSIKKMYIDKLTDIVNKGNNSYSVNKINLLM